MKTIYTKKFLHDPLQGSANLLINAGELMLIAPRIVKWALINLLLIFGLLAFSGYNASGQTIPIGSPGNAIRWTDGDHWTGTGCGIVSSGTPKGIIGCGNAAGTQSSIAWNTYYTPSAFSISGLTTCIDPDNLSPVMVNVPFSGQKVSWLNFDVRPSAGTYEFQTIATGNYELNWALYYSTGRTCSTGANNLSGDPYQIFPTPIACGTDFTGWSNQPFVAPGFTLVTNLYMVVWKRGATNSSNDNFDFTFKARYGCGDSPNVCTIFQNGPATTVCNPNGTYTVTVNLNGTNGTFTVTDPNARSISTIPSPLTFTNVASNPGVVSGTVIANYNPGVNYNLVFTGTTGCSSLNVAGPGPCCIMNASISGTTTVCQNASSPNITINNPQPYSVTITYKKNDVIQPTINIGANTSATLNVPTNVAGIFTYNLVNVASASVPGCSNAISGTATVTVQPLPTCSITGAVGSVCPSSINIYSGPAGMSSYAWSVSGNGSISGSSSGQSVTVIAGTNCDASFTLNLSVTDGVGCISSCIKTVYVMDNTPPLLTGTWPSNINGVNTCLSNAPAGPSNATIAALYTDACGGAINVSQSKITSGTDCSWNIVYTYIIKDQCNNTVTPSPTFTISGGDWVAPALTGTWPSNNTGVNACLANAPAGPSNATIAALYTDGCGGDITVTQSSVPSKCTDCSWTITYTYTIKDKCNNVVIPKPTFIVSGGDLTPPILTGTWPSDITNVNECLVNAPAGPSNETIAALYIDVCGGDISATHSSVITGTDCSWSVVYTYTIKDKCDNIVTPNPTFTISGGVLNPPNPLVITVPSENLTMECYDEATVAAWTATATAIDNCGGSLTVLSSYTAPASNCNQTVTVTFSTTDACLNTATATKTFTVNDITKPAISCPGSPQIRTIGAGMNSYTAIGNEFNYTSLIDNCIDVTTINNLNNSSTLEGFVFSLGTTTVTWAATDACGNENSCSFDVIIYSPSLTVTKVQTSGPDPVTAAGQVLNYTITVVNTGNQVLTGVIASDLMPDGNSGTLIGPAGDGGIIGAIDVGETWTYTISYTATLSDLNAGLPLVNTASIITTEVPGPTTATETTPITQNPSISMTKTGTLHMDVVAPVGIANAGDQITYTFTVTNTGNTTLTGVVITDPVVSVSGTPIASLAPGATDNSTFTAVYTLTQADIDAGTFTNVATATGTPPYGADVTATDDDTQTLTPASSISMTKTGTLHTDVVVPNTVANAGDQITYTFTVTNTGNTTLTGVIITDPLVSVSGLPIASLAPGATDGSAFTAVYTLTQADIDAGIFTNVATANGTPPFGADVTATDDDTQALTPASSISMTKTGTLHTDVVAPNTVANAGDQITYTFTVTNTGNTTLTGVVITDPLVTVSGLPIASLAPGATDNSTFTAVYTLTQADIDAGTFTNVATATGTPPYGADVTATDDDTQALTPASSISMTKTGTLHMDVVAPVGIANAGDQITYTFTVTNTGNTTLTGVVITDPLVSVSGTPIASLAPGATDNSTFTAVYTLTLLDVRAGTFTNIATATGNTPDGGMVNSSDDDTQDFIFITGNIYDDANGMNNSIVSGSPTNASGNIYINLVSSIKGVVASILVNPDGTYYFTMDDGVEFNTTYTLVLTNSQQVEGSTLTAATYQANWVSTGEILGLGAGNDGLVDGILAVNTNGGSVFFANFGLDQLPIAFPASGCYSNPGTIATVAVPLLTGADAEDGPLAIGHTITITSLATNGTLYYNGVAVTLNQVIYNYNPSLLRVDPNNGGLVVNFNYAFIDAAGMKGSTALVTMNFNALNTTPQATCSPNRIDLTSPAVTAGSSFTGTPTFSYWLNASATIPMTNPTTAGNGTYYIKATTEPGCYDIKPVTVTINPLPTLFIPTGSGSYCAGGIGRELGLNSSQVGVNYTLWYGCCILPGLTIAGTGGPISFGYQTSSGLYSISAVNVATQCTTMMNNCAYIWIDQPVPVSVSIDASPVSPITAGTSVTFTAMPTNGGTMPSYQWKVNGLNVGTNSPVYTYTPLNEDEVTCVVNSNAYCVSGNPASKTVILEVTGVVPAITVTGIVTSGKDKCYNALQTLTVAGNGTTFTVQNGGSVTMIAGQNIIYLPGAKVNAGGYMHGLITTNNQFCGQKLPAIPMVVTGQTEPALNTQSPSFTIYPNPTSGNFIVEQKGEKVYNKVDVEVYGMRGEKLMKGEMTGEMKHEFWVSDLRNGLYFVKIVADDYVETIKLIKTTK
ncbi:MAG: T9SS type A sorting domain-containing protein [Bacteroidales bacterium]|nr:T9SS type A sorting domain-containing protein [Bacteroidales bacterium]